MSGGNAIDHAALIASLRSPTVGYPTDLPERKNGTWEQCGMLYGPCSCGAWHRPEVSDTDRKEAATVIEECDSMRKALRGKLQQLNHEGHLTAEGREILRSILIEGGGKVEPK
jgi:hypothetical protein